MIRDFDYVRLADSSDARHFITAPSAYSGTYRLPERLDRLAESLMIDDICEISLGDVVSELRELPPLLTVDESRGYLVTLANVGRPLGFNVARVRGDRETFAIVRRAHDVAAAAVAIDSKSMRATVSALATALAELIAAAAAIVPPDFVPIAPCDVVSDPAESLIGSD